MVQAFITIWLFSGLAFWIKGLAVNGLPSRFYSQPRQDGWGTVCFVYLPVSIALGPVLWAVKLIIYLGTPR